MKRFLAVLLSAAMLLTGCASNANVSTTASENTSNAASESSEYAVVSDTEDSYAQTIEDSSDTESSESEELLTAEENSDQTKDFRSLNDPKLLQYIEDHVYSNLSEMYQSEDYIIENVKAIYVSEEYLEEAEYNTKSNIFFGYTLDELDQQFQGNPYVFTLDENGKTTVVPFEDYDDTYDRVIKNVAIGTGVILVCVTVSVVTAGAGAAPVSMVFAAAAKTGTTVALSSGAISAAFAGVVTGVQTKDFDQAIKSASLEGSKAFKWGAIGGALSGGVGEVSKLRQVAKYAEDGKNVIIDETAPEWRQAEQRALQKYGGKEQVSFQNGKEVPWGTPDATRPDVIKAVDDHLEAIEVKYYDLSDPGCKSVMMRELKREVKDRIVNMPSGTTQRVVLDVTDRGFSPEMVERVAAEVQKVLQPIYKNIPVDIVGL